MRPASSDVGPKETLGRAPAAGETGHLLWLSRRALPITTREGDANG